MTRSPECRVSSSHRFCLDHETYIINDHYDFEFDYKRRRNETEYEVEHVPYSFYQGGPRMKPESCCGTEDWEEYQSHLIPGILNMSDTETCIRVVNQTETPITLYANQPANLYVCVVRG